MKLTERQASTNNLPSSKSLDYSGEANTCRKVPLDYAPASSTSHPVFIMSNSGNTCDESAGIGYEYDSFPKITSIYTASTRPHVTGGAVQAHDSYQAPCNTPGHPRDGFAPWSAYVQSPYADVEVTRDSNKISLEIKEQRTEKRRADCAVTMPECSDALGSARTKDEATSCLEIKEQQTEKRHAVTKPECSAVLGSARTKDEATSCATKDCEITNTGSGHGCQGKDSKGKFDRTERTDETRTDSCEIHLTHGPGEVNTAMDDAVREQTNVDRLRSEVKLSDKSCDGLERLRSLSEAVSPEGSGRWSPLSKKHIVKKLIAKIRDLQEKRNQEQCEEKRERLGIVTLALYDKLKALMNEMKQSTEVTECSQKKSLARVTVQDGKVTMDKENSDEQSSTSNCRQTILTSKGEPKLEEKREREEEERGTGTRENVYFQEEPASYSKKSEELPTNEITRKRTWAELGAKPNDSLFGNLSKKLKGRQIECAKLSTVGAETQQQIRVSSYGPTEKGSSVGPHQSNARGAARHGSDQDRPSQLGKPRTSLEREEMSQVRGPENGQESPRKSFQDLSTKQQKRFGWRLPFPSSRHRSLLTCTKRQRLESSRANSEANTRDNDTRARVIRDCEADAEKSKNRPYLSIKNFTIIDSRKVLAHETKAGQNASGTHHAFCTQEQTRRDTSYTRVTTPSVCKNSALFAPRQGYCLSDSREGFSCEDDTARQNNLQLRDRKISNLLGKQGQLLQALDRLRGRDS